VEENAQKKNITNSDVTEQKNLFYFNGQFLQENSNNPIIEADVFFDQNKGSRQILPEISIKNEANLIGLCDSNDKFFCDQFLETSGNANNFISFNKEDEILSSAVAIENNINNISTNENIPLSPFSLVPTSPFPPNQSHQIKENQFLNLEADNSSSLSQLLFDSELFEKTLKEFETDNNISMMDNIESSLLTDENIWAETFSNDLFAI